MNPHIMRRIALASVILASMAISSAGPPENTSTRPTAGRDSSGIALKLKRVIAYNSRDQYDSALLVLETLESSANDEMKEVFPIYLQFSETYSYKKDHIRSYAYLEKARALGACDDNNETQFNLMLMESNYFLHSGYYNQALNKLHTLKNSPVSLSASVRALVKLQYNLARCHFLTGKYDSSLYYYDIVLKHKSLDLLQKAKIYDAIGITHAKKANYATAEKYFRNSLSIKTDSLKPDDEAISYSYNVLGLCCWRKGGAYSEALNYLSKSAAIRKKKLGIHGYVSDCYNNMGLIYREMGQYHKAIEYLKTALDIRLVFYGPSSHPEIGGSYNNIGLAYMSQGDYLEAKAYMLKALEVKQKFLGEKHQSMAHSFNNLGTIYTYLENYDSAHIYLTKSLDIHEQILSTGNPDVADTHKKLAVLALDLRHDFVNAKKHYDTALAIRHAIHGDNHFAIAAIYNDMAYACNITGQYKPALVYAEKSMLANKLVIASDEKTPTPSGYANVIEYFYAYKRTSRAYWGLYQKSYDTTFLQKAFIALRACDSLSRDYRQYATETEDELYHGSAFAEVYDGLVSLCEDLYRKTNNDTYLRLAFSYSEKGRAAVLRGMLSNAAAKQKVALPENLLLRERKLKNEINTQKTLLRSGQSSDDEVMNRQYRYNLFETTRKLNELIDSIEQMHPLYYRMKYADDVVSVEQIQATLLASQAVIEYAIADSMLYAFVITKNNVSLSSQAYAPARIREAQQILQTLGDYPQRLTETYNSFADTYHHLFESLMALPMKSIASQDSIKHLIIIPAKELNYVSFELLLTDKVKNTTGAYRKLPYLLNTYAISYAQSASVMLRQKQVSQHHTYLKTYGGFAPRYDDYAADSLNPERNAVMALKPLKWNAKEVEQIAEHTSSDSFTADEATEVKFKNKMNDYNIVHLAMHATVNDADPMNSMLVFSPAPDSVEDGFLFTYELLGMEAFPELVVLSACNTGVGKIRKGEGAMSLAYGFATAGCLSTIVSQWQIDDESTHHLMRLFFDNLLKGNDKQDALREAKRSYLANADPLHANPIYWAGFVLVGDWQPISLQADKPNYTLLFLLGALMLSVVIGYALVRR